MKIHFIPAVVLCVFSTISAPVFAEHTRVTNPNALTMEFFGRGILYSIQYDRVFDDNFSAGIGFGSVSVKTSTGADVGKSATLFPIYMMYYFAREQNSLFLTGGANFITNADSLTGFSSRVGGVEFSSTAIQPTFGIGFESRADAGFLFRVAGYAILAKTVAPWVGFTLGYSF